MPLHDPGRAREPRHNAARTEPRPPGITQSRLGTKFRPKSIFERGNNPCNRFGNLLGS
jgi:hypothetical protein